MNLAEQQQPSMDQQNMAPLSTEMPAEVSAENIDNSTTVASADEQSAQSSEAAMTATSNPLSLLEARLSSMANAIVTLNSKVIALRKTVAERDAQIAAMEQEKSEVEQQVGSLSTTHSQMIDGLEDLLKRFPHGEEMVDDMETESTVAVAGLLDETVGSA